MITAATVRQLPNASILRATESLDTSLKKWHLSKIHFQMIQTPTSQSSELNFVAEIDIRQTSSSVFGSVSTTGTTTPSINSTRSYAFRHGMTSESAASTDGKAVTFKWHKHWPRQCRYQKMYGERTIRYPLRSEYCFPILLQQECSILKLSHMRSLRP